MVKTKNVGEVSFDNGRIQRYSIKDESITLLRLETTSGYYSATWETNKTASEFIEYTKDEFNIGNFGNIRISADYIDDDEKHDTYTGRLKRIKDKSWFPNSINFIELNFSYIDSVWVDGSDENRIELTVYESNPKPIEQYFIGTVTIPQVRGDASGEKINEITQEAVNRARTLIKNDLS